MNSMTSIDLFLESWWGDAMDWYLDKFRTYQELFQIKKDLMDEYGYHSVRFNQVLADDYLEASENLKKFMSRIGNESAKGLIQMMFYHEHQHRINPSKVSSYDFLADILNKEKQRKKLNLIARIEKKAGKMVDTRGLTLGVDSNLNGLVIGDKETVSVHTIYAGGYNIQCLHFRVLVKII